MIPTTPNTWLPPQSLREAQFLAALGSQALPLLQHDPMRSTAVTTACMQTLALLQTQGVPGASAALQTYTTDSRAPIQRAYQKIQQDLTTWKPVGGWSTAKDLHWLDKIVYVDLSATGNTIHISGARSLEGVHYLAHSPFYQQRLEVHSLDNADLTPLAVFTDVTYLKIRWCEQVSDLTVLARLPQLHELHLQRCKKVIDLSPLAVLTRLQKLNFEGCEKLVDLSPLAPLTHLRELDLTGCTKITNLSALASLTLLEKLEFPRCKHLVDLSPLAGLLHLQSLNLSWGVQILDSFPLANLSNLETIDLSFCQRVKELPASIHWSQVKALHLHGCYRLTSITALASSPELEELDISHTKVTDITPLTGLSHLKMLNLDLCSISNLAPLASLSQLEILNLGSSSRLTDLLPLLTCTALRQLTLPGTLQEAEECKLLQTRGAQIEYR